MILATTTLIALIIAGTLIFRAAGDRVAPPPTSIIPRAVPAGGVGVPGSPSPPLSGVTVAEIANNPERYVGQTLTLWGEVDAVIGRQAFTIGDGDFVGDNRLLILSTATLPMAEGRMPDNPVLKDDRVRLSGPVSLFDIATAERELGVELDPARFDDWRGRPAIVARSLRLIPQQNTDGVPAAPVSTADLIADPGLFQGRTVTATGQISRVLAPGALVLNDQVLVTYIQGPVPDRTPEVGQFVIVHGPFRLFSLASFEREIGRDLPDAAFAPFDGKATIIEATIRPAQ